MIEYDLLESFSRTFFGYGNYRGDFWFIGMEEGGGTSREEIAQRINVWQTRGKRELEDLKAFHQAIGVTKWFGEKATLQKTWQKLIRFVLAANGYYPGTEAVRSYQATKLGSLDGQTCLVELLPLPSPSSDHWLYKEWLEMPMLQGRDLYRNYHETVRAAHIQERIEEFHPKYVVAYGKKYIRTWQALVNTPLSQIENGVFHGRSDNTQYLVINHPLYTENETIERLARRLAEH